jgi:DNA polymerase-1
VSFFASGGKNAVSRPRSGIPSLELLHRLECKACPLKHPMHEGREWNNKNPDIPAAGSSKPLIYVLGEAPGAQEDAERAHFVGKSGQLLRAQIPREFLPDIRWNNVVRTRPPENREPDYVEVESCRPSIIRDIEHTKPKAIFGFGAIPLSWAAGQSGLNNWRGRRLPVQVGSHTCWFYSFHHPAYITRSRDEAEKRTGRTLRDSDVGSEDERVFRFDLARAFAEIDSLPPAQVVTTKEAMQGVEWVTDCTQAGLARIEAFLTWAGEADVVGVDYETNSKRPYAKTAKVLTIAVGTPLRSLAFPYLHSQAKWSLEHRKQLRTIWTAFLNKPRMRKAVHNLPFELEWSAAHFDDRCLLHSEWEDTMSQAAVLDERTGRGEGQRKNEQGPLSLDFLVRQYFGLALKALSTTDTKNLDNEPLVDVLRYNAMDAKFHCMLSDIQMARIRKEGFLNLYEDDLYQIAPLTRMQLKGLPVNQDRVEALSAKYTAELRRFDEKIAKYPLVAEFERLKGTRFDPSNNPDVTYLVRDMMKRKEGMRGESGSYSVEEDVLKLIGNPLTNDILARRKITKVKSTYNDGLRVGGAYLHDDGMLHPQTNTTVTATGRTSMEDPNGQNWPKRNEGQKEVRSQIEAPDEHVMVAIDYGQIQARNIAMESKDPVFVKALWERYDVHMEWAERLAHAYPSRIGGKQNLTDKKIMKDWRQDVKNKWTFPLFFGSVAGSVADNLEIPLNYIKPEYEAFWRIFSGVKAWQERLVASYRKTGYVEALSGRRRRAPLTQNQIINSPIQADEACLVKDAMARVVRDADDWDTQPSLMIHDDLTFIMPKYKLDERLEFVIDRMLDFRHYDWINVPITVEVAVGKDWEHLDKAGDFSSDQW